MPKPDHYADLTPGTVLRLRKDARYSILVESMAGTYARLKIFIAREEGPELCSYPGDSTGLRRDKWALDP